MHQEDSQSSIFVSQNTADKLKKQALEFQKLYSSYNTRFLQESNTQFYILSLKWLNQWKQVVSYDEMIAGKAPGKQFGKSTLDRINSDIEDNQVNKCFKYFPLKDHPWNTFMKEGLIENQDYIIVDKEIWTFFTTYYHGNPIVRLSNGTGKEKMVAVNLLRFKSVLLYPSVIKQISQDRMYKQTFEKEYLQVDRNMKFKDYYALLQRTVPTFSGSFARDNSVRLWRYTTDQKDQFKALFSDINKQVGEYEMGDDMVFDFSGDYLTSQQYETIEDVAILEDQLIVIEFKDDYKPWCIQNKAVQVEGKCSQCQVQKILNFPCVCRKVSYCSAECKQKDSNYHSARCEKYGSDDETIKSLSLRDESAKGVVGLSNLGNTCFMNSGTQCISNTYPLTEYFLSNQYFDEINMDNPIGTKGQLVKRVGALLKKMWYGEKHVVTPTNYKKAVGQFQPMFKGYHQHDSSELITFVLDGIHEDLNRVKKKPYVETKDSDGKTDFVIAKESWLNHLARNQSIIVDLMHGQYKSTLRCPKCQRLSITFDPYLMVQLGIPSQKKRFISFRFYNSLFSYSHKTISFDKNKNMPLSDYFQILGKELNVNPNSLIAYIANNYSSYEFLSENKSIVDVRKQAKRATLCFRKLADDEIQNKNLLPIQFTHKYSEMSYKKQYLQNGFFFFDGDMTLQQVHQRIFYYHSKFFEFIKDVNYEKQVLNQYYSLYYKSNANYWNACAFCQTKNCQDCEVKYNTETVNDVKNRALKSDAQCNFEIIILWKDSPFPGIKLCDIFDKFIKLNQIEVEDQSQKMTPMQNHGHSNQLAGSVSLYDCLQFSQEPEQLNPDNTWYCKDCKDHVQAYKSMQIYKAPKILIFTLKRFKASNRMFKQKLETFVDFPINGLDMTDYLINTKTPSEYENETEDDNGEQKKTKILYDLYAISNHFGGLGGGHYTAYAKNKISGKWYNFDDSHAGEVSEQSVVTKAAYVLCYQLRTDDKDVQDQTLGQQQQMTQE